MQKAPTPTSTPPPAEVSIAGTVAQCATPTSNALAGVTMTLIGTSGGSTLTDGSGNYTLSGTSGGSHTVTPTKAARLPGSSGINTTDVIAVQRHFLGLGIPLSGCLLLM
jgi:hypothetical protein